MAAAQPQSAVRLSPYNVFWLLHVIMELPIGILAFISPYDLPYRHMTPTAVLLARVCDSLIQLLGSFLIASSVSCLLNFALPDFLPGKRAFAVQLLSLIHI